MGLHRWGHEARCVTPQWHGCGARWLRRDEAAEVWGGAAAGLLRGLTLRASRWGPAEGTARALEGHDSQLRAHVLYLLVPGSSFCSMQGPGRRVRLAGLVRSHSSNLGTPGRSALCQSDAATRPPICVDTRRQARLARTRPPEARPERANPQEGHRARVQGRRPSIRCSCPHCHDSAIRALAHPKS